MVPGHVPLEPEMLWALRLLAGAFAQVKGMQNQRSQLSLLSEAVGTLDAAAHGSPREILRKVSDLANEFIAPCARVCIWVVDDSQKELVLKAADDCDGMTLPLADDIVPCMCARLRKTFNVPSLNQESSPSGPACIGNLVVSNSLCVPVEAKDGQLVGVLQFVNKLSKSQLDSSIQDGSRKNSRQRPSRRAVVTTTQASSRVPSTSSVDREGPAAFSQVDEELASVLASSVATALRISGLVCDLQQNGRTASALARVLDGLQHARTVEDLVMEIRQVVKEVLDCERVTFYFVDRAHQELWSTPTEETPFGIRLRIGQGHAGRVAGDGRTYRQNNVQLDARHDKSADTANNFTTRSIVTVPVKVRDAEDEKFTQSHSSTSKAESSSSPVSCPGVLGVLQALNKRDEDEVGGNFNDNDTRIMESLAAELAVHLQRHQLEMMAEKARLDVKRDGGGGKLLELESLLMEYHTYRLGNRDSIKDARGSVCHQGGVSSPALAKSTLKDEASSVATLIKATKDVPDPSSWEVDLFSLGSQQIECFVLKGLQNFGVFDRFSVCAASFLELVRSIASSYQDNPYHNWQHGVSTFHISYMLLTYAKLQQHLSHLTVYALLVAALGHDLDHPGTNNAFQTQAVTELAVLYNDHSVLEMHHAATLFKLITQHSRAQSNEGKASILGKLQPDQFTEFRRTAVAAILSTDMKHHGEHVNKAKLIRKDDDGLQVRSEEPADQELRPCPEQDLVDLIVHSADIGAHCLPTSLAQAWSIRVLDEFSKQVVSERELGLPVTPFMDGLDKPIAAARSQISFIEFVVAPLWDTFTMGVFPQAPKFKDNLAENRNYWEQELASARQHEAEQANAQDASKG